MTKLRELAQKARGCWPDDCEAFIAAVTPERILAYEDAVEALRKALPVMRNVPEYNVAKYALAALDALEGP